MIESAIPQFGIAIPGVDYSDRPSAYGLAMNVAGRVLVCRRSRGRIVLPGGGLFDGETAHQALLREVAEETAHRVSEARELCTARQYHSHRRSKPAVNKLCRFFAMTVAHDPLIFAEEDHQAVWLSAHELIPTLTFESHRWALERFVAESRREP